MRKTSFVTLDLRQLPSKLHSVGAHRATLWSLGAYWSANLNAFNARQSENGQINNETGMSTLTRLQRNISRICHPIFKKYGFETVCGSLGPALNQGFLPPKKLKLRACVIHFLSRAFKIYYCLTIKYKLGSESL